MTTPLTFGDLLAKIRDECGVYQRQVKEAAGVSLAYVCDWEKGRRNPPTSATVLKVVGLLKEEGASDDECSDLVMAAARTRGSFVFDTEDENTLQLLTAIVRSKKKLTRARVDRLRLLL